MYVKFPNAQVKSKHGQLDAMCWQVFLQTKQMRLKQDYFITNSYFYKNKHIQKTSQKFFITRVKPYILHFPHKRFLN